VGKLLEALCLGSDVLIRGQITAQQTKESIKLSELNCRNEQGGEWSDLLVTEPRELRNIPLVWRQLLLKDARHLSHSSVVVLAQVLQIEPS